MSSPTETIQPAPVDAPSYIIDHQEKTNDLSYTANKLPSWNTTKTTLTTKEGWFGDYDYGYLCLPQLPGFSKPRSSPFYGLTTRLPLVLAIVMGFQHALAMIAGVVTPALLMSGTGPNALNFPPELRTQMISTSMITSGILSLVQITRFGVHRTKYFIGTGLLSVVGTSFIYVPVLQSMVGNMYRDGTCTTSTAADGSIIYNSCPDAWGAFLGSCIVCSIVPILFSFLPPRVLKKMFPPIVTGLVVSLIGAHLIQSGISQWAGGSGPCKARPTSGIFMNCPSNSSPMAAPWGSPRWVGLGFLVFAVIVFLEFFGSPFMKNAQVVIGLIVGMIVSAAAGYTTSDSLNAAPAVTFLWVHTYKLSVYPPVLIPLVLTYILAMVESIGDITATCEVSRLDVEGKEFESRLQGGILADGIAGTLSALFMNSPQSCYAQNNGIISLTRCANTMAGYACCVILILMGVFSKFGALFLTMPDAVLGGMTTFLFSSVLVSGIRILSFLKWTRRERFIVTAGFCLGMGVQLVPGVFTHLIVYNGTSAFVRSLADSANIVLDTSFVLAAIVAMILNALMPAEVEEKVTLIADDSSVENEIDEMEEEKPKVAQV